MVKIASFIHLFVMILRDIKVLDFTRLLPGPLATSWLVQAGATVLKIEDKNRPDGIRAFSAGMFENAHLFEALNTGKELWNQYTLEELVQAEAFRNRLAEADVLIEQFKPGLMEKLGLGYEALKAINPRLIYVSLSGFGSQRPEPAHDINFVAEAGLLSLNRDASGKPVIPEFQLGDVSGSFACYTAVLEGIIERGTTGMGCFKDVSMTAAVMPFATLAFRFAEGGMPKAGAYLAGSIPNYNVYRCADGNYVALGALEFHLWKNLCAALEMPENLQPAFNNPGMVGDVQAFFETQDSAYWLNTSKGKNTCLSPVCHPGDAVYSQLHQDHLHEVSVSDEKTIRVLNSPFGHRP